MQLCTPVVAALGLLRQEDQESVASLSHTSEPKASWGYVR